MKIEAYYYQIKHKGTGEIVDEGIIRDSEDVIHPKQTTGIEELPFECEAHHFKSPNYKLEGWMFELTREEMYRIIAKRQ